MRPSSSPPETPVLAVVGGFLGARKTTLLLTAGRILARRGWQTAIITNDQGEDLVDSQWVAANGVPLAEVGGGCFCCRFSELRHSLGSLLALRPHVVFAEAVGSCTDLAATVLRPMQESCGPSLRIAPLTVVIDPGGRKSTATTSRMCVSSFASRRRKRISGCSASLTGMAGRRWRGRGWSARGRRKAF